jgi:hypothetical protein
MCRPANQEVPEKLMKKVLAHMILSKSYPLKAVVYCDQQWLFEAGAGYTSSDSWF